jgi:hypothetical protein
MPKNYFWDILVKTEQIKKNFFGNSFHILEYKKAIKPQKFCLTNLFSKKVFFLT